jgi:DNA transposition AAA+ family ATPase
VGLSAIIIVLHSGEMEFFDHTGITMSRIPVFTDKDFFVTRQHKRFAEFCDACRQYRYIGNCYGSPRVGKTWSAAYYARWDLIEPLPFDIKPKKIFAALPVSPHYLLDCRTVVFIPEVNTTPSKLLEQVEASRIKLKYAVNHAQNSRYAENEVGQDINTIPQTAIKDCTELIIVDEAERLKVQGLEQLRDIYDKSNIGLILMGMPGLEKSLSRYPQLYSRVGFVHQFNVLSHEDMLRVIQHKWRQLETDFDLNTLSSKQYQAISAIVAATANNFRLVERLFSQIERVMRINDLTAIDKVVVETAREMLVIGSD